MQAHWIKGCDLNREGSGDACCSGETTASDGGTDPEAHRLNRNSKPASSPTDTVLHCRRPPDPGLQVGEGRGEVGEGWGDPSREGIHSDEGALEEEGGCGRGRVCRQDRLVLVARKDRERARARELIRDERQERESEKEREFIWDEACGARKKRDAEFTTDGREKVLKGFTRGDTCMKQGRNEEGPALEQGDTRARSLNTTRVRGPGTDGEAGGEEEEKKENEKEEKKENVKQEDFVSIQGERSAGGLLASGRERPAGLHRRDDTDDHGFGQAGVCDAFTARRQREVGSGGGGENCAGVTLEDGKEGDEMAVKGGRHDDDGGRGVEVCGGRGAGEERGGERVIGGRDKGSDVDSLKGRVKEAAAVGEEEGGIGICFQLGTDGRLFVKALVPHGPAHAEVC